jgi:hypothetical protein
MTNETSLNDRWSRVAQSVREPVHHSKPRTPVFGSEESGKQTALEIAGLTAEQVRKHVAKYQVKHVTARDKDGQPATALANVISVWIEVTPDMAHRWLKTNFRNRPVTPDTVLSYARDMALGRWQPTHQGIAFNDRDELIDGQHRLIAVIKCGLTVRMMVTFGLPSEIEGAEVTTMDCVDRGRTRSVADQLKIQHGLKDGGKIAGIASAVAHLCVGERVRRMSVGQTLDVYRAFEQGVDFVIAHSSKRQGLRSVGVLAAFAFAYAVEGANIEYCFGKLNTGVEIEQSPVIQALRNLLTGEQSSMLVQSMNKGIAEN